MKSNGLRTFTGNDLQVVEKPEEIDEQTVSVILDAHQPEEFLASCAKNENGIIVMPRRLLLAHGIIAEKQEQEIRGSTLRVKANLRRTAANVRCNLIPLIQKGMYLAKPHHFNGRSPINADRLNYALRQRMILMEHEHLDVLPEKDKGKENMFYAPGTSGELQYYREADLDQLPRLLENRMRLKPGEIDRDSEPVWVPANPLLQPGTLTALRIEGLQARFHTLLHISEDDKRINILNDVDEKFYLFDQNNGNSALRMEGALFALYDRRPEELIAPEEKRLNAKSILLTNYGHPRSLLGRLARIANHDRTKRVAALVRNQEGIRKIRGEWDNKWVSTVEDLSPEDAVRRRCDKLETSLAPATKPLIEEGGESAEMRLLKRAQREGMDGGCVLVCETFPQHATVDALNASGVHMDRGIFDSILFRKPSLNHGPYFSGHDYNALRNSIDYGIGVYWANDTITRCVNGTTSAGNLLQLTGTKNNECIAFVPRDRREAFKNGLHMACYGTARTLMPQYIAFMEQLFQGLGKNISRNRLAVHSGGGPNTSTMGIANRLARQHGFLSIGHVLGLDSEPTNDHIDGLMPFRKNIRGIRQQNMAAAADIVVCLEGGGGTREERGISLTDIAIARDKPYPIILVGTEFYHHEYLQYLHEVSMGTLDANLLHCISIVDSAEEATQVIEYYEQTGEVLSIIPKECESQREAAIESFGKVQIFRKSAWGETSSNGEKENNTTTAH